MDTGNAYNLTRSGLSAVAAAGTNPEDVIQWWSVPEELVDETMIHKIHRLCGVLGLPCFWPFLCCTIPLAYLSLQATRSRLDSLILILTPSILIYAKRVKFCVFDTGMGVESLALKDLQTVKANRNAGGNFQSFPKASVEIQLPGIPTTGGGNPRIKQNSLCFPARDEEVDGIIAAILRAKERAHDGDL